MALHPLFISKNGGLYPALLHKVYTKDEWTYRNNRKVDVERTYVQGLKWDVKHEEILPVRYFLKDAKVYFALTDDIDRLLRQKIPRYRD